jgi:hypothetical protein
VNNDFFPERIHCSKADRLMTLLNKVSAKGSVLALKCAYLPAGTNLENGAGLI